MLAGEDDAYAPLESVREVAELLGGETEFHSVPGARHSIIRDVPETADVLHRFLDGLDGSRA